MKNLKALPDTPDKLQKDQSLPHNIEAEQQLLGAILLNNPQTIHRIS